MSPVPPPSSDPDGTLSWPLAPLARPLPGLALLRRRLPVVLLAAVIGLALGLGVGHLRAREYQSTTYITVASRTGKDDAGSVARAAQALARVATTPEVIGGPLRKAGLIAAAEQPRMFITVQAAPDAPLISVTGVAPDAREAQAVAATVSDTLAAVDTLGSFKAFRVADPPLPSAPSTPAWLVPAGGAGLGLALALVLAAMIPGRPQGSGPRGRPTIQAEAFAG
jgi:capsular polysaccharide biosynthesis protein